MARVLNTAETPPFESTRNGHRRDAASQVPLNRLRRPEILSALASARPGHAALPKDSCARVFVEVETGRSSRVHAEARATYRAEPALAVRLLRAEQSPQLFKQLLLVAASSATTRSRAASATRPARRPSA